MKSIGKYKEQDPMITTNNFIDHKLSEKLGHKKRPSVDFNTPKPKDTPTKPKKEETTQSNFYTTHYNSKRNFFSSK